MTDMATWAHNTDRSGPNEDVPVVVTLDAEQEETFFHPGERNEHWHPASDQEVAQYEAYWNEYWGAED